MKNDKRTDRKTDRYMQIKTVKPIFQNRQTSQKHKIANNLHNTQNDHLLVLQPVTSE